MQYQRSVLPMTRCLLAIVAAVGLFASPFAESVASQCRDSMPKEIVAAIEGGKRAWRLVETEQLSADDRKLWPTLKHGPCPGLAKGNFDLSGRPQFAVLVRALGSPNTRLLHAARGADGRVHTRILFEGDSANSPVVYAGKPGKYSTPEDRDRQVTLKAPPVILATLESGATAYYFVDGEVRRLLISE